MIARFFCGFNPWIDGSNYADKDRLLRFQVFPYDLQNSRTVLLTGKPKIEDFVSGAVLYGVKAVVSGPASEVGKRLDVELFAMT
jgi:hypothetical protein